MNDILLRLEPNQAFELDEVQLPNNWDVADLNREATAWKDDKNWGQAILCLYQARRAADKTNEPVLIASLLRLPLFLQQAGYFEEAKFELAYLLKNMDKFIKREIKGLPCPKEQLSFYRELYKEAIFNKASLIFKRQKDKETATFFAALSEAAKEKRIAALEEVMIARRA